MVTRMFSSEAQTVGDCSRRAASCVANKFFFFIMRRVNTVSAKRKVKVKGRQEGSTIQEMKEKRHRTDHHRGWGQNAQHPWSQKL